MATHDASGENGAAPLGRILAVLKTLEPRLVACSGGVDSMLLATLAHRAAAGATKVLHATSPAVPGEATRRVRDWADSEGWCLTVAATGEFTDAAYLSNPLNRCYYCKSHLYAVAELLGSTAFGASAAGPSTWLLSGANLDDLGEFRPGLTAASERGVRHPFIEAGIGKAGIRAVASHFDLPFADLPASPCLASRLYTGTAVTPKRLAAVEACEALIRQETGLRVVRCRIRESEMIIEVPAEGRDAITAELVARVRDRARAHSPTIEAVLLDSRPYRPGRAFVAAA